MNRTVVVTGAAGFVGGQTMLAFKDIDVRVIGVDLNPPPSHLDDIADVFLINDFSDAQVMSTIQAEQPMAIVHCGGSSLVGPSMLNPRLYYDNNFCKTQKLLDFLIDNNIKSKFVFSSSSSVYGEPQKYPCVETDTPAPVSPYGESKRMVEIMLQRYGEAYGLDWVAFRYFNVVGADSQARHGQAPGATHIIARILESIRDNKEFTLNGTDYPTPDGTCVRDHVHVEDVANAHVMATFPELQFQPGIYNVGEELGISNQEIIDTAQKITGRSLRVIQGPRRPGDPSKLVGSTEKLRSQGWQPQFTLEEMITHAWTWYQQ